MLAGLLSVTISSTVRSHDARARAWSVLFFPTISMVSGRLPLRRSPRKPTMRRRSRARTWRSQSSIYGPRSERTARLIDQMELELEELEAAATEDELAAEQAAARTTAAASFTRKRPSRQPSPAHLPREPLV